ncbi:MAG: OmpP1/FadL family transporter [Panacagrimonas sp.]
MTCFARPLAGAVLLAGLAGASPALATNGFYLHGFTAAQRAMAGSGTALAGDVGQLPLNPAGLVGVAAQWELDLNILFYRPSAKIGEHGAGLGLFSIERESLPSVEDTFFFPFIAYGQAIDDSSAWGVSLNGGGLKSVYEGGSAQFLRGVPLLSSRCAGLFGGGNPLPGNVDPLRFCGRADRVSSADLTQLFFRAAYAKRFGERFSIGLSPIIVAEYFRARGLQAFDRYSVAPGRVTDNGLARSPVLGFGARLGLLWSPADGVGLGASFQSRIRTGDLDDYTGLIPGDVESIGAPAMWNLGVAWRPVAAHLFAADFERINFSDVAPIGRRLDPQALATRCLLPRLLLNAQPSEACFGGETGPGFGWRDSLSYKLGYRLALGPSLALSLGYTYTRIPVRQSEVVFNILAPGITPHHYAAGLGWELRPGLSLNFAALYTPKNTVSGKNPFDHVDAGALIALVGAQTDSNPGVFGADPGDQDVSVSVTVLELVFGVQIGF